MCAQSQFWGRPSQVRHASSPIIQTLAASKAGRTLVVWLAAMQRCRRPPPTTPATAERASREWSPDWDVGAELSWPVSLRSCLHHNSLSAISPIPSPVFYIVIRDSVTFQQCQYIDELLLLSYLFDKVSVLTDFKLGCIDYISRSVGKFTSYVTMYGVLVI